MVRAGRSGPATCSAGLLTAGSLAMAGQPSPNAAEGRANAAQGKENAGKPSPRAAEKANNGSAKAKVKSEQSKAPPKVRIAHCGCNYDGSGLEWKHIRVSRLLTSSPHSLPPPLFGRICTSTGGGGTSGGAGGADSGPSLLL